MLPLKCTAFLSRAGYGQRAMGRQQDHPAPPGGAVLQCSVGGHCEWQCVCSVTLARPWDPHPGSLASRNPRDTVSSFRLFSSSFSVYLSSCGASFCPIYLLFISICLHSFCWLRGLGSDQAADTTAPTNPSFLIQALMSGVGTCSALMTPLGHVCPVLTSCGWFFLLSPAFPTVCTDSVPLCPQTV